MPGGFAGLNVRMSSFWRYRIRFCKRGTIRFISHRDLMGVFARAFRRARLPVRMSQGFNPHPRFSLPVPLPVGVEGLDEVLELDLVEDVPPAELVDRLGSTLPEGLTLERAAVADPPEKARPDSVTYRACGDVPPGGIERCLAATELRVVRRNGTERDVRPFITRVAPCEGGCEFDVFVTGSGSARPTEVLDAIVGEGGLRRFSLVRTAVRLAGPPREDKPGH
jgi:radical SAM-linked protein